MLLRILVFLLIAYVVWSALKSYLGVRRGESRKPSPMAGKEEEMVFDPQCQSYVPKGDAISQGGEYFCSQECARLYLTR